jgi:hypothetical protein
MGFFNFFRKIFSEGKLEELEEEKIEFSEVGNWIEKKREENKSKEKELFDLIQNKIDSFVKELRDKMEIAREADISSKKAEERFKLISEKGKKEYLEFAEKFINSLYNIDKNNLKEFGEKLNKVFIDFNKSSNSNYERATILIGKEMANIKEILKLFSRDLMSIFKENQYTINSLEIIYSVESKLKEISGLDEECNKIEEFDKSFDDEIFKKENERENFLERIDSIRKSEKYVKNISLKKEVEQLKNKLEKNIFDLRQFIDFKSLANFYHIFEDKMKLIKEYRDDFKSEIKKNNGKEILKSLLDESNLNNDQIRNKIEEIKRNEKEIFEKEKNITSDETFDLQSRVESLDYSLEFLKLEKSKNIKRSEDLKIVKDNLVKDIKNKVQELGGKF